MLEGKILPARMAEFVHWFLIVALVEYEPLHVYTECIDPTHGLGLIFIIRSRTTGTVWCWCSVMSARTAVGQLRAHA